MTVSLPSTLSNTCTPASTNLGVENVDLIQFHSWSDAWLEDDRWVKKIDDLRQQGLFRAVGISINRWEPRNGARAVMSGLIDSVQVIYNIFDQNPEDELFPACAAQDVGGHCAVPIRPRVADRHADLSSKWPEGDWRNKHFSPAVSKPALSAPTPEGARPARHDAGANGIALHSEQSHCEHDDSRHAQGEECGREPANYRTRSLAGGPLQGIAQASLGSPSGPLTRLQETNGPSSVWQVNVAH